MSTAPSATKFRGVDHLGLSCTNTAASRRWYEAVGFEYPRGYHGMHWFRLGDADMLYPSNVGSAGERSPGFHATVGEVDTLVWHVVSQGLEPFDHRGDDRSLAGPVTRPCGDREFELRDPDGHDWAFTRV